MVSAQAVANRFLELARTDGRSLTPMQVLKLVYLAHGWMLGLYSEPLLRREDRIEAWMYGPVIPSLYDDMRQFGRNPVTGWLRLPDASQLNAREQDIVDQTYNIYGNRSGISLSALTHEAGSPWDQFYTPEDFGQVIPNEVIMEYYRRQVEQFA